MNALGYTVPVDAIPMGTVARFARERRKVVAAHKRYGAGLPATIDEQTAEVPCNGCTGCCRSNLNVRLYPQEGGEGLDLRTDPEGYRWLRKNTDGSCIHLVDNRCSVYAQRPVVCRAFDCRSFAVAAIAGSDPDQKPMWDAVRRWEPEFKTREDFEALNAARIKATSLFSGRSGDVDLGHMADEAVTNNEEFSKLARMASSMTRERYADFVKAVQSLADGERNGS